MIDPNATAMGLEKVAWAFEEAMRELIAALPGIIASVLVLSLILVMMKPLNSVVRKLLKTIGIDSIVERVVGSMPISVETLIVLLLDVGLLLLGAAIAVTIIAPQYVTAMNVWATYALRLISALVLTLITFFWIEALVNKIRAESKIRAFASLVAFLLVLAFIIDLTALSETVKSALVMGIALGLGLVIGVFAFWYFLHDVLASRKEGA